jgi:hypothetical protein
MFGSESVDRRSRRFERRKIDINLAAMMDVVLHHGAQPLPHGEGRTIGRGAPAFKVSSRHVRKHSDRLAMQAFSEPDDFVAAHAVFLAAPVVTAAVAFRDFEENVQFVPKT